MKLNWGVWVLGLVAATIQGGAGAVVSAVTVSLIAPDKFNLGGQLHNFLLLTGVVFTANAVLGFFSYLAKHPTPDWDGTTDRRNGHTATPPSPPTPPTSEGGNATPTT